MASGAYNGVRHIQWRQAHTMGSGTYNGVRHIQWGQAHTMGSGKGTVNDLNEFCPSLLLSG